jgi:hypothetical protein
VEAVRPIFCDFLCLRGFLILGLARRVLFRLFSRRDDFGKIVIFFVGVLQTKLVLVKHTKVLHTDYCFSKHGTFRPSLTKQLASNTDEKVEDATKDAFAYYAKNPNNIKETIEILTAPLKGIGPSAGSLILSVHDPEHVIFFSDEAYRWLVKGGEKTKILYNVKESRTYIAKPKLCNINLKSRPLILRRRHMC